LEGLFSFGLVAALSASAFAQGPTFAQPTQQPVVGVASFAQPADPPPALDDDDGRQKLSCPSVEEMREDLKPITQLSINIRADGDRFPPNCAAELLAADPSAVILAEMPRPWGGQMFHWKASNLHFNPLYFEDIPLERYGQTRCEIAQPFISAGKFYVDVFLLPYRVGMEHPCEDVYALGYHRPGSCTPFVRNKLPLSAKGGLTQGAVIVGLILLVP
jgi:hypothetical protein